MATPQKIVQETLDLTLFPASLLQISSESAPLNIWQSGVIEAIQAFLIQIKSIAQENAVSLSPLMISYVPDENTRQDIENAAKLLQYCFTQAGMPVTLCPLRDVKTLAEELNQHTYTVVLCTPQYAQRVEENLNFRQTLDTFGRTKKNALHPLLCEGGFADTALKIVDGHYLIRSYQAALKKEPLNSIPAFIDIFLNLSGNQGLGILSDVLDLKETKNAPAELAYRMAFNQLESRCQQLTIDYRLKISLEQSTRHPLQDYLNPATFPVVKDVSGFQPVIDELLGTMANVSLLFCPTKADTELTSLALTQALITINRRVLSIDCADYPGKAAGECVRLALQKMGLKTADREAMKAEPVVILLKGYENIGAYDNLWVKNKLSTWSNVKLLVTCRADFFKFRGYLSCFLADVSNRQVDDLLVYKVPSFASVSAQKISLSLTHTSEVLDATEITRLNPRKNAEQIELAAFLKHLNTLWVKSGYLKNTLQYNPLIFISYAWEADKADLARQQGHLSRISQDLATLGFSAWLDIERMSGDIDEQMAGNIANSQAVLVIQTPRYTERSQQSTNVKKEFDAIVEKAQNRPDFKVFPLRFLQGTIPSVLENHRNQCDFTGIDEDYLERMTHPDFGLISKLLLDSPEKKALYQVAYSAFQEQLQLLVAKHLVVNQGQDDVQAYDIDNRLKGYIEPYGLSSESSPLDARFDLSKHFQSFLNSSDSKTSIILGRAGSGKSLFALTTFKNILQSWDKYRNVSTSLPNWLPIYIQLRKHTKDPERCIENTLRQQFSLTSHDIVALKQGLGHNQHILFILDGYDELGSGVYPNLSQSMRDWPLAKLLITGRPEHFNKDHQPLETLSLTSPEGSVIFNSAEVIYVSPFSPDEIQRYVVYHNKGKNEDTYQTLQKLPGMMALLDNPFLLTLVLQSLPQLLKNRSEVERAVTRTDIYQAFIETWVSQETKGRDLNPKECEQFSQELAFRFFQAKTISVSNLPEKKDLWDFFSSEANQAAQDASPLRLSGGEFSFVHKSIWEFLVAMRLWKAIPESDCLTFWQTRPLTEERAIIDFLAEIYRAARFEHKDKSNEARLMSFIESSRASDFPAIASSNAITVLNAAKVSFSGRDFKDIRIPGADLTSAILDNTCLENADLSYVAFTGAWLHGTNFKNALLTGISLGAYPSLSLRDSANSCCYSPDGRLLGVAAGKKVQIYNASTRMLLRVLESHTSSVTSVHFSPNSKTLASGSWDNSVKLWDVETGQLQKTLQDHHSPVTCITSVHFSPNSKTLASGSWDNSVKLWDVETGQLQKTLEGHVQDVYSVHFSPDSKVLASGSRDKTLKLWDIETGQLQKTLKGHTGFIDSICFSSDGKLLASSEGGNDINTLKLWDVGTGSLQKTLEAHTGHIHSVCFSPDGKLLASGSDDYKLKLWDVETGQLQKTLEGHIRAINSVCFSPDGKVLVSGSRDKSVRFWDIAGTRQLQKALESHSNTVQSVHFSPDCKVLASGGKDKRVKLWDAGTGDLQKTLECHSGDINSVHFSPDGRVLASGSTDYKLKLWDVETWQLQKTLEGHSGDINSVCFSPDSKVLASGSADYKLKLWDVETGQLQKSLEGHTNPISSVRFSPHGKALASASWDRTLKLWDPVTGKLQKTLEGYTLAVTDIHFSPDGKMLASASWDETLKLWDVETGTLQKTLEGHSSFIHCVHFSPDSKVLVSGSLDNTLRLWDNLSSQEETNSYVLTLNSAVNSLSFQKSGENIFLVSGHADYSVRCWQLVTVDHKPYLQLLWTSLQNALLSQGATIEGARGLSVNNADLLKERGAVGRPLIMEEDHPDWHILHLAVANNNREQIYQLVQKNPATLEEITADGSTALHIAARYNVSVIEYLLSLGANGMARDLQGNWPGQSAVEFQQKEVLTYLPIENEEYPEQTLHLAIKGGYEPVVRWLLQQSKLRKMELDINAIGMAGDTPLLLAARYKNQIATLLLENGAKVGMENERGEAVAHIAASKGQVELLKLLRERGVDLLAKTKAGDNPLHYAVYHNQVEVVKWFLAQEVSLELKNNEGETAVHLAAGRGYIGILKILKERGASLTAKNSYGFAPFHCAACHNKVEAIEWLLEQGMPIELKDDEGSTAVHIAAYSNHVETLKFLKERGADLFSKGLIGSTPLHRAAAANAVKVVEWLLDEGVFIDALRDDESTPLHRAAAKGANEAVQLLLKKGANIKTLNQEGKTPLQLAYENGKEKTAKLIEQFLESEQAEDLASLEGRTIPAQIALQTIDQAASSVGSLSSAKPKPIPTEKPNMSKTSVRVATQPLLPFFKSTTTAEVVVKLQKFVNMKSEQGYWQVSRENNYLTVQFNSSMDVSSIQTIVKLQDFLSQLSEWKENVKEGKLLEGGVLYIQCKQEAHAQAYEQALQSVLRVSSSEEQKLFIKQHCVIS